MVRIRIDESEERWAAGFTQGNDVFQRRDLADRLSNLYASLGQGSVAIFDGPWGVGKSTFVKMWRVMLNERSLPSVYIDAFAQDYITDPFEALCGTFVKAAKDAGVEDTEEFRKFTDRAARVGKSLLPTIAKIGIKAATVGLIGSSEIEAVQVALDASSDAASEQVEERLKNLLANHERSEHSFGALRDAIASLVDRIDHPESDDTPRLVIIIDELDRCRPSFAVGLLEIIKHFFRVEGVHFLLVTNRSSLVRSFAAVHNLSEEADEYLGKFYDFIIHLPLPFDAYGARHMRDYVSKVFQEVLQEEQKSQFSHDLEEMCATLATAHRLSLRQVNSFVLSASLCNAALRGRREVSGMIVAHLILLKIVRPELYQKAKVGSLTWEDIKSVIPEEQSDYNSEHIKNVFGYFLAADLNDVPEDYRSIGRSDRLGLNREQMIPYSANAVVDLFAQPTESAS